MGIYVNAITGYGIEVEVEDIWKFFNIDEDEHDYNYDDGTYHISTAGNGYADRYVYYIILNNTDPKTIDKSVKKMEDKLNKLEMSTYVSLINDTYVLTEG